MQGERRFNRTFMCQYCYQLEESDYCCSSNTSCNARGTPTANYIANCTARNSVTCLRKLHVQSHTHTHANTHTHTTHNAQQPTEHQCDVFKAEIEQQLVLPKLRRYSINDPISWFSESLKRDLSNDVLQSKILSGGLICHFSALDRGI